MQSTEKKHTVLIVDDDVDFLEQMKIQLTAAGYEPIPAESQKEAEQLLAERAPDAAVLDLMMEHTDTGFALAHKIKKARPEMPVIIVTGVTSETGMMFDADTRGERSWIKADAVLAKPIRFEQLRRELQRLLTP